MTTTSTWTREVPDAPGYYWVRKQTSPGVKQLRVAELVSDDEIWLPGVARAARDADLADWEWWPIAIDQPPR